MKILKRGIYKMDEDIKPSYYSILPASIRYNKNLRFGERLLYGEITALTNKEGYCYAKNKYFADLYDVSQSTISRWISHLAEINSIKVEIIRKDNKEIIERRIYITDNPYMQKYIYPYTQNNQYPIRKKSKDNNININIDRLFNCIIKEENEIPNEFSKIDITELYGLLEKYEMLYTKEQTQYMSKENLEKIKEITYAIALIVKNNLQHLTNKVKRDKLIEIYNNCKTKEKEYSNTENKIENFIDYYFKSIKNELTSGMETYPSFFMPENKENGGMEFERDI